MSAHEVGELLAGWNGFYVMIGSSAAALTGLMFVVISLAKDSRSTATADGIAIFSTPTVYHFCSALFTAALITSPIHSLTPLGALMALNGAAGLVYVAYIAQRARRVTDYQPDLEDWCFHVGLPALAYAIVLGGAIALDRSPEAALFAPATAVIMLVFIGIHNAWDVVTFLAKRNASELPAPADETANNG